MTPTLDAFIARWAASGAAERANYQLFLSELCDLLGVERPHPATADPAADAYVFEKPVPLAHGTTGFIDLYRRGCFVLEAKQGAGPVPPATSNPSDDKGKATALGGGASGKAAGRGRRRGTAGWDTALERARAQAQTYARSLPAAEAAGGRPPFLVVVDVGNTIDLYSEFTRSGGNYVPFPDPHNFRLRLDDLRDEAARDRLRAVWDAPLSLDPARRSARVTRAIAERLAELARTLERGHDPDTVAHFLMRCLFTMFAEDVGLLPEGAFTQLLAEMQQDPTGFRPLVEHLWHSMNVGGFSVALRRPIPRFNGGLFADPTALPLDAAQIALLSDAARADWRDVEPAIFGTLLERALDPVERHKLGAHYTPRAYVERLVGPAVIEPLRAEWQSVQAAALRRHEGGDDRAALAEVEGFLRRLAHVTVLDPACGSGNFLYVTLEQMKRLEGEALNLLRDLGGAPRLALEGFTVTPQQFRGIEVNPRAAAIAELVLWIGYLQWHRRTRGEVPPAEPIIRDFHNIERRDAVLAWDAVEPLVGPDGRPVTRWDGRTTKRHPTTGELVPDETAQLPVWRYINPRPAAWPAADFVVGNPPFIGNKRMRLALGDGYVEALRNVYKKVPNSVDYVMYWWDKAATLLDSGKIKQFGFVTTNSITQTFNRRIVDKHLGELSIVYAISDHPWVDSSEGADVRIAMTVARQGMWEGLLLNVVSESPTGSGEVDVSTTIHHGRIHSDLKLGADVANAQVLAANEGLSFQGVILVGDGFRISKAQLARLRLDENNLPSVVRPYMIGRDLMQVPETRYVIDFFGLTHQQASTHYPELMQKVIDEVKPLRDQNNDRTFRENWWLWGRPRPDMRVCFEALSRYIATCRTATHRTFAFLSSEIVPDAKLIAIGLDDAYYLGLLSSSVHVTWAMASGAWLGVGNDSNYNHSECFAKFPFPDPTDAQKAAIRALAEQLDAHRKRQQALHPRLTLTDMYNVLAKLRAGEALGEGERRVHEQGLVSLLRQLHDELDAAVLGAYGWDDLVKRDGTTDYTDFTDLREESVKSVVPSGSVSKKTGTTDYADSTDFSSESVKSVESVVPSSLAETILERLVALNAARAEEEGRGVVRWLRPAYQLPRAGLAAATQPALLEEPVETFRRNVSTTTADAPPWPAELPARAAAVRAALAALGRPANAAEVAAAFAGRAGRGRVKAVGELLATLVALGQARAAGEGGYVAE